MSRVLLPRRFNANEGNVRPRPLARAAAKPSSVRSIMNSLSKADLPIHLSGNKKPWADLPVDILHIILSNLYGRDSVRFRLTCKRWRSLPLPVRSLLPPVQYSDWVREFPWLISLNKYGVINLFHPISNETFVMNIAELAGSQIYCSNFGWLLMSHTKGCLFFFNPFTRETIWLPEHDDVICIVSAVFTAPPTSFDCMVFVHCTAYGQGINIHTCGHFGEEDNMSWREHTTFDDTTFIISAGNTLSREGKFYHLDVYGRFGVFDPKKDDDEEENENAWKMIPQKIGPEKKTIKSSTFGKKYYKSYIAKCEGKVISVFVGFLGYPVRIFEEASPDGWVELESLDNRMMFISESASILLPATVNGTENKIYFPRFPNQGRVSVPRTGGKVRRPENESRSGVFYCLQTRKYCSFGSNWFSKDLTSTVVGCSNSWIQPSLLC